MSVDPLDVRYLGTDQAAWAFLVRSPEGLSLVECGPAASWPHLLRGLEEAGVSPEEVGDLLLTHIHLDHAGAAGHVAERGATVHVHPFGQAHLADPSRLITSSRRVHGEAYERFYGDLRPVRPDRIRPVADGERVEAAGLVWRAVHTPGHARHHVVWMLDLKGERHAFMGDLAGILVPGSRHILIPTPPPEFDPLAWAASLDRVAATAPDRLWLTHGGCVARNREEAAGFIRRAAAALTEECESLRGLMTLPDAEAIPAALGRHRVRAAQDGVSPRRMEEFVDEGFVRMNLAGARRAFAAPLSGR